ncbi:hypothetical protein ABWH96_19985 [Marivirga tractuosa]|uniref:hypothetical protein n=1 Tax=Marivirga tractuosa TaxID=1006 RepID=UPI0035D0487D
MKFLRKYIASKTGKIVSSVILISILLNNILIPEMERFNPNMAIENNAAGLLEILVEDAVNSDLFETDEHDDSSDNLVDGIQKFLNTTLNLDLTHVKNNRSKNQSIYPIFRLAKGYQLLDTPPPKFL